jgi:serine/threonine-protein kinase TTK/MPS1
MEHGEIDLSDRLRDLKDGMDENFLRVIWMQMLQAVHAIHRERIIHGDLKPANFLFVNGALKLIDFGIAKAISNDTTNIERDSQVGTVNYMSPEAIQGNATPNGQRNPHGKMKVS